MDRLQVSEAEGSVETVPVSAHESHRGELAAEILTEENV